MLYLGDPLFAQRFFGGIHPLQAITLVLRLGLMLLAILLARGWFALYQTWQWLVIPSYLAALFALIIILVDLTVVFPKGINVLFPHSLLFYPVMGFVVEIVFHLLPLTVLLIALTVLTRGVSYDTIIWPCLIIVTLLEPIYQTMTGSIGQSAICFCISS